MYPSNRRASRRQVGSVLINATIALSVLIIALVGIELGYLFFMKREFQKSADLAALAGAQVVVPTSCAEAKSAAIANASQNLPSGFQLAAADITCGRWDPDPLKPPMPRHFSAGLQPFNAVLVSIQRTPALLLPNIPGNAPRQIAVEALAAKADASAAFSVGSRLLRLSGDSTLGALLKAIGLNLDNTIVLGYEGLASVKVTPGDLLCELGTCASADVTVAGLNSLLDANLTLGQLLDAIVRAGNRDDLLDANVLLISAIKAKLDVQQLNNVKLGSLTDAPSLFASITTPGATSALETQLNALDLIQAAVGVATGGHAIDIPELNVSLLGLVKVTAKAGVVEPPSFAIGVKGITAYTAQVRTFIHVRSDGALSSLLKVNLPIALDLVSAKGTLIDLCTPDLVSSSGKQRAEIAVEGAILKGCIGKISNSTGSQDCSLPSTDSRYQACFDHLLFSKKDACEQNLSNLELINVLGLLNPTNSVPINALAIQQPTTVKLEEGQTGTAGNSLNLGNTVSDLVSVLTNLLFGSTPSEAPNSTDITSLANQIWNDSGRSVADGGAGCTADTTTCRAKRLENARLQIAQMAEQSGLLNGLLNGIGDLLGAIGGIVGGDGCSYTGLLGSTSNQGCVDLLKNTLSKNSSSSLGGVISNASAVATGLATSLLQPVLNLLGSAVLTPLLQDLLGIHLGEVDVRLHSLQCKNAQLVY